MEERELMNATCPECRGPLTEVTHDGQLRVYECLVGHKYTARALLQAHSETQERELWSAVVALEEATQLVDAVAPDLEPDLLKTLRAQAGQKREQAGEIRGILERLEPFRTG